MIQYAKHTHVLTTSVVGGLSDKTEQNRKNVQSVGPSYRHGLLSVGCPSHTDTYVIPHLHDTVLLLALIRRR